MPSVDVTVEICGMSGDGTIAAGGLLNEAMSRAGFSVLAFDSYPAEIRGFGRCVTRSRIGDEEMLALFHEANFEWVFIGIESPDEDSLKETKKMQNTNQDILASVRAIYAHGIDVLAGFIIGFDNDTTEVFDKQYRFIKKSGIQSAMIGLLTAVPKTPLYERLEKEGRLIEGEHASDNSKLKTNVIPKGMKYQEMVDGYRALHYRLFSDRGIADRIRYKTRFMKHRFQIPGNQHHKRELPRLLQRFFVRTLLGGGFKRVYHFLRSVPITKPKLIQMAVSDWVVGLSMRDYMDRHFVQEYKEDKKRVKWHVERMKMAFRHRRHKGALGVSSLEYASSASTRWGGAWDGLPRPSPCSFTGRS